MSININERPLYRSGLFRGTLVCVPRLRVLFVIREEDTPDIWKQMHEANSCRRCRPIRLLELKIQTNISTLKHIHMCDVCYKLMV